MRLLGICAVAATVLWLINWLLSGGLLRVLVDEPVLWLLVLGLPATWVVALLLPDRPRTVRVAAPVVGEYDDGEHVHLHVHHHQHVTVEHRHVYEARVQHDVVHHHRAIAPVRAIPGPRVIDGQVVQQRAVGAIEEGR